MSEIDLAWLGGFTAGDGMFEIARNKTSFNWRIAYSQALHHPDNLAVIEDILKKQEIPYSHYLLSKGRKNPQATIQICRKQEVRKLLKLLIPHLRSKTHTAQAELMLRAIESTDKSEIEFLRLKMKGLKSRSYDGKRGGRKWYKLEPEHWPEIKELLKSGKTLQKIADQFNVTKQAIWYLKTYYF